ncbi:MAG TPA: carbohydrate-binding family V/XII, partial [Verrucomicrobiae bacterium]|nr:carbohydrate-binding family V/XII [Verrucomicrobiae bacterium]
MKTQRLTAPARRFPGVLLCIICLAFGACDQVRAQNLTAGQAIDPSTLSWPRFRAADGYEFALYQPAITAWPSNQLQGRLVVAVRPAGTSNETYGVVFFQARTDIDKVNRLVTFEDFQITRLNFPTQPGMEKQYRDMLLSFRSQAVKVLPLDQLEAVFAASANITQAKVQAVKNNPPKIFYATQPSLLVLVDGPPVLRNFTGDYQRVINTRAILLFDQNPQYQDYYLYADNQWFTAPALAGPWTVSASPPSDIDNALSLALASKDLDSMRPKNPDAPSVTQVFVSTAPAELLQTAGAPNLVSVPGTDLLYVQNSGNAIFYYLDDGNYYVLISGRWFKSQDMAGPWAFVPPDKLPGDFKNIPADSDKSNVLMSVAGTPQAREAVIANSIPQTATIQRDQAKLEVTYYGAPSFTPIAGTTLAYAANTQTPVIMVSPT